MCGLCDGMGSVGRTHRVADLVQVNNDVVIAGGVQ